MLFIYKKTMKQFLLDREFKIIETENVKCSKVLNDDYFIFTTKKGNEYILILKKELIQDTSEINFESNWEKINMFDIVGTKQINSLTLSFATKKDYEDLDCENPFKVITNNNECLELVGNIIFLTKKYLSEKTFDVLIYNPLGNNERESKIKDSLFLAFINHQMKSFNTYKNVDTGYTYLIILRLNSNNK